jgi:hypothetical protein
MRSIFTCLTVLVGLTVSAGAENCDTYNVQPYDGETTQDQASLKRLANYWSKNTCFKYSDQSEPNMEDQCKDICFPKPSADDGKAITLSQTCDFGGGPWIDANSGKPLLCGKDKDYPCTLLVSSCYLA